MKYIERAFVKFKEFYLTTRYSLLIEAIVLVIIQSFTLLVLFNNVINLFSGQPIAYTIALAIWVISLLIIWILLRRIKNDRRELIERNKFIEHIANEYNPKYEIVSFRENHRVLSNGDGDFSRHVTLKYTGEIVVWYEMALGTTNETSVREEKPIFQVFNDPGDKRLAKVLYKREPSKVFYAIILDPILSPTSLTSSVKIYRKRWKEVWAKLVEEYEDNGILNIHFPTEECILEIELPENYDLDYFEVSPYLGDYEKIRASSGNYQITLKANHVQPEAYKYKVGIKKLVP